MVNQPDRDTQGVHSPARKLVLPEPPDAGQHRSHYSSPRPDPLINQPTSTASHGLFTRLFQLWRKDPAYMMLSLAIALVVIAALLFAVLGVHAMTSGGIGNQAWSSAQTQHPVVPTPSGTVDHKPSFPTPVSGKGSSHSSQPGTGPTPSLRPTPTSSDQGTLDVQIVDIPDVVNNQSRVQVEVQTSEPHVEVRLQVTYDAAPFFYSSSARTTSGAGDGTLTWNVRVSSLRGGNNAHASVTVIATDQDGQQATSDPVTVTIAM